MAAALQVWDKLAPLLTRLGLRIGLALVVYVVYKVFKQPRDPRVPEVHRLDLEKRRRRKDD